jgi:hypothetical protein
VPSMAMHLQFMMVPCRRHEAAATSPPACPATGSDTKLGIDLHCCDAGIVLPCNYLKILSQCKSCRLLATELLNY